MSWKRFKFGNQKLYVIPGTEHRFRTEHDAKFYCDEHGIDFSTVEKYDSKKEYARWLELQILQRAGEISELRRQVEFELIPAKYETEKVKDKVVREWFVPYDLPFGIKQCMTRKEAETFAKATLLRLIKSHTKRFTARSTPSQCIRKCASCRTPSIPPTSFTATRTAKRSLRT